MPQQPQNSFQQQQQQNIWSNNGTSQNQFDTITAEQLKLREQIMQSEKNLSAQHQVISFELT